MAIPTATASVSVTYPGAVNAGDLLIYNAGLAASASSISSTSDGVNGNWSAIPPCANLNGDVEDEIWYLANSAAAAAGSLTVTVTFGSPVSGTVSFADIRGIAIQSALDQIGTCGQGTSATPSTGTVTPSNAGDLLFGGIAQVGSNTLSSIAPSQPTFVTFAGGSNPLAVPLYVLNNQFPTGMATINVTGASNDFAGLLTSFTSCVGSAGNGAGFWY